MGAERCSEKSRVREPFHGSCSIHETFPSTSTLLDFDYDNETMKIQVRLKYLFRVRGTRRDLPRDGFPSITNVLQESVLRVESTVVKGSDVHTVVFRLFYEDRNGRTLGSGIPVPGLVVLACLRLLLFTERLRDGPSSRTFRWGQWEVSSEHPRVVGTALEPWEVSLWTRFSKGALPGSLP